MILYFTDRQLNIVGQASTELPEGLTIIEDLKTEDVESGVAVFECKIPYNGKNRGKVENCAEVGNYILRSHNGANEFYTVIDSEIDTKNQEVWVYAEDAGLDLLNSIVGAYEADKAYPITHYIELFAHDSGFVVGVNEAASLTRKLSWDGESTAAERLASVATQFDGCEISFSFDIKNLEITNKYINIHKERGQDIGAQLRLNIDIDRIVTKKSIANLATALEVTGGTPEDENTEDDVDPQPITLSGLSYDDGNFYVDGTMLKSRDALNKWGRYSWAKEPNKTEAGGHIVRLFSYDTTSQTELLSRALTELKKRCEIEVNYEVDLNRLPGNVQIGDRINIIDDAGELYVSARVLQLEESAADNTQTATIGEYLIRSSGISDTVADLAANFAKTSQSAARALKLASAAKTAADDAQTQVDEAIKSVEEAQKAVDEVADVVEEAKQSAANAQAAADNAQAVVDGVEGRIESLEGSLENAETSAANAQQAAQAAQDKAYEADAAAAQAKADAADAKALVEVAQTDATTALTKADEAKADAATAKTAANDAKSTADAAKADAAKAQSDIDGLADELDTVSTTMSAEYARKTDLTEAEASLQSQITQNAAQIASTVSKVQTIDETTNDAQKQLVGALEYADDAQAKADEASAEAAEAQAAADEAQQAANDAQSEADTAKAAADNAQEAYETAKAELKAAQAEFDAVSEKADATEEEIAAAQKAVDDAQAAADTAKANAEAAIAEAETTQKAANKAVAEADLAQQVANAAASNATIAQTLADNARGDATAAQQVADEAAETAEAALADARTARESADTAQRDANDLAKEANAAQEEADAAAEKATQAESDLAVAEQRLADVMADASATEKDIADAQAAVDEAETAATAARTAANNAQTDADAAQADADAAQAAADAAKTAADEAQAEADAATQAAAEAKAAVEGLAKRTTWAETKITQNAEEIAMRAKKTEVTEDLDAAIGVLNNKIVEQSTSVLQDAEKIILSSLEEYAKTGDVDKLRESVEAQLEVMSGEIAMNFTTTTERIDGVDDGLNSFLTTFTKYIKFTGDTAITIGSGDSTITLEIDNETGIVFKKNGEAFGRWDGTNFYTGNIVVEVNERAQFGNFAFVPRSDGSLMLLKVGG